MRVKIPPDRLKLQQNIGADVLFKHILNSITNKPLPDHPYYHWDQVIRRTPPDGLTTELWWMLLKTQRAGQARPVPLPDKQGRPFTYVLADPIPEELHKIDLGAGGVIQMPDQITNKESRDRYYKGSLMEEAITSSQLEGATTTREVAKEMIRSGRSPRDKSEQMILNNFLTMQHIGDIKDEPMSPEVVFQLHKTVTENTLEKQDAGGRFRKTDEQIVVSDQYGEDIHVPPPADQLPQRMQAMCDFANGKTPGSFIHPVIRSIVLHFWLAYDHPFVDGNGRTARALFYWSMLRNGFWLFEFVSISRILVKAPMKYGRSFLYTETDDNDLTYFIIYQIQVIRRAIDELHEYIARKSSELQKIKQTLRGSNLLNHRQEDLVNHAMRHPGYSYTISEHQKHHGVVYETARSDMLELLELGLLIMSKEGKRMVFEAVPNLDRRLREVVAESSTGQRAIPRAAGEKHPASPGLP